MLTPLQASEYCYENLKMIVSSDTVRHWIRKAGLRSVKIAGRRYIEMDDLEKFLKIKQILNKRTKN